jgi:hypothetical protein
MEGRYRDLWPGLEYRGGCGRLQRDKHVHYLLVCLNYLVVVHRRLPSTRSRRRERCRGRLAMKAKFSYRQDKSHPIALFLAAYVLIHRLVEDVRMQPM